MCKVTQFFNSKKVGVDAVDDVLFLASLYMEYCKIGGEDTALSFNMEKRRQSPLPHLWRMGHFFFVLYVSILSFSQKACFCHF